MQYVKNTLGICFVLAGFALVLSGILPGLPTLGGFAPKAHSISVPLIKASNKINNIRRTDQNSNL